MISVNIVRVIISKGEGKQSVSDVRYVPLVEYDLWKFLMSQRHNFAIKEEEYTIWIDEEEYEKKKGLYPDKNLEFVNRIIVYLFAKSDNMIFSVNRYFPKKNYDKVKQTFLSHLAKSNKQEQSRPKRDITIDRIVEIEGYCVKGYHNLPL